MKAPSDQSLDWKAPLELPLTPNVGQVGFSLALDGAGQPVLAYANETTSGFARCTGDCNGTSGQWTAQGGPSSDYFDSAIGSDGPGQLRVGVRGLMTGPALALGAGGKVIIGLTASAHAFGGECGTGSAAAITRSFLMWTLEPRRSPRRARVARDQPARRRPTAAHLHACSDRRSARAALGHAPRSGYSTTTPLDSSTVAWRRPPALFSAVKRRFLGPGLGG
jgi:hypothetical protein